MNPTSSTSSRGGRAGRDVRTVEDLMALLDSLFAERDAGPGRAATDRGSAWWDGFYADRDRDVPFLHAGPDESLVDWAARGLLPAPGRALDVGCGPGRNALWLGRQGWTVDAVDLSAQAVAWSKERLAVEPDDVRARVRFEVADALVWRNGAGDGSGGYHLVVDSGCLHHLPPHRRVGYLAMLDRLLAPGGAFALACFLAGEMGTTASDADLLRTFDLEGGAAFAPDDVRSVFRDLAEVEVRPMRPQPDGSGTFGMPFLLVALFRRPA